MGCQLKLKLSVRAITQTILADGVDFKVVVYQDTPKLELYQDLLIIMSSLRLIPVSFATSLPVVITGQPIYWGMKYRHKPIRRLVGLPVALERYSGTQSPISVSDWKIAVCKLEQIIENKGSAELFDMHNLGIMKLPKKFFYIEKNQLYIRNRPSESYPHIWRSINEQTN